MGRIAGAAAVVLSLSAAVWTAQRDAGDAAGATAYALTPVPLQAVQLTDDFWRPRLAVNRDVSLPHILRENERTGRLDNFARAARLKPGPFEGRRYNDTDVYKAVEAASYVLAAAPDAALDRQVDGIVALIAAAQEPDGYLFTTRTIDPANPAPGAGATRWEQLNSSHELYNAGHLYEAAVAHFQATGKRALLDVAIRSADLVVRTFGSGARRDVPGHQEIELALVKLFRVTGNVRYLETARFFLEERGRPRTHPRYPPGSLPPGSPPGFVAGGSNRARRARHLYVQRHDRRRRAGRKSRAARSRGPALAGRRVEADVPHRRPRVAW
jgi:hypothetical protein